MRDADRWHFCFHCNRAIVKHEDARRGVNNLGLVHVACYDAHKKWSDEWDAGWERGNRVDGRLMDRIELGVTAAVVGAITLLLMYAR